MTNYESIAAQQYAAIEKLLEVVETQRAMLNKSDELMAHSAYTHRLGSQEMQKATLLVVEATERIDQLEDQIQSLTAVNTAQTAEIDQLKAELRNRH